MSVKLLLLYLSLAIATFIPSYKAYSIEQTRSIVVVDFQMVLERSLAAQSIRVRIEELSKNIQRQMDLRTSDLKKLEQDILKKKGLINEKSYEEELLKFNKKISDLRREAQSSKGKIEQAYSEAINKLNEEISKIINELSNEHGFEVVLPAKLVIFSSPKLNITELIIERLNSRLQEIPVHYQG